MTPNDIDRKIAESFELLLTMPSTWRAPHPLMGTEASPLGHWFWQPKWEYNPPQPLSSEPWGNHATMTVTTPVDRGSWQPVSSTEPRVTLKMLEWLVSDSVNFCIGRSASGHVADAIRAAYIKARNLRPKWI